MDLKNLYLIRKEEFNIILDEIKAKFGNKRDIKILEIGAGNGYQSKLLSDLGYSVKAIDVTDSNYKDDRIFDVVEYNGKTIPFAENFFDFIFSSSVLEHIQHISAFQSEMQRVLTEDGIAVHIVPNGIWRFFTNITYYFEGISKLFSGKLPKRKKSTNNYQNKRKKKQLFFPPKHGKIGNFITELYYFSPRRWRKTFSKGGWKIDKVYSNGIFYTGYTFLGQKISLANRKKIAKIIGGVCDVYILTVN